MFLVCLLRNKSSLIFIILNRYLVIFGSCLGISLCLRSIPEKSWTWFLLRYVLFQRCLIGDLSCKIFNYNIIIGPRSWLFSSWVNIFLIIYLNCFRWSLLLKWILGGLLFHSFYQVLVIHANYLVVFVQISQGVINIRHLMNLQ